MRTLELNLPEPTAARLEESAERLGVSPEELLVSSLEEKLAKLDEQFNSASDYILNKNSELYKRLA